MTEITHKMCAACGIDKPVSEFAKRSNRKTPYQSYCRPCHTTKRAEWGQRNPEAHVAAEENARLMYRFGIRQADYDRMYVEQDGKCAICGSEGGLRRGDKVRRLHVDHCHATGEVRSLLCRPCNVALGHMKDDPDLLIAAAFYLLASRGVICV